MTDVQLQALSGGQILRQRGSTFTNVCKTLVVFDTNRLSAHLVLGQQNAQKLLISTSPIPFLLARSTPTAAWLALHALPSHSGKNNCRLV